LQLKEFHVFAACNALTFVASKLKTLATHEKSEFLGCSLTSVFAVALLLKILDIS
jgi:hypothetical protein